MSQKLRQSKMTEISDMCESLYELHNVLNEWDEEDLKELPRVSILHVEQKIYDMRRWIEASSSLHEIYIYLVMDCHALIKTMYDLMINNAEEVLHDYTEDKHPCWSDLTVLAENRATIQKYVVRTSTMLSNIEQQISSLNGDLWEKYKSETDQTRKEKINKYLVELVSGKIM